MRFFYKLHPHSSFFTFRSTSLSTQRFITTTRYTGKNTRTSTTSVTNQTSTKTPTKSIIVKAADRKESFHTSLRNEANTTTTKISSNSKKSTLNDTSAKGVDPAPTATIVESNMPTVQDKSYFPATDQFDPQLAEEGLDIDNQSHNWSTSFYGLSTVPFSPDIANILQQEVNPDDVEIKPDGLLYLPEIKYRRILNKAFGPGGWGLAPRGEHSISSKNISREYALICHGRFVSQARGEQDFFDTTGLPTASEGCKSNALMRCCKDLGIASELWDPVFIRKFKKKYCVEVWTEHVTTKRKKKLWRKKDDSLEYPYKETGLA
ncbi:putative mitochondrial genome maintenance protein Mgm101 [Halteromyces radiatus]|uniref:putative mitochondrial genome maintenance protein Mgm101 n=1 Tax=Halteromyces radiatus TaxID=101107 RepID=UPI0022204F0F|nr:putative mitochondrial genome maintenance protein Mgm101 [Halteromyces radiatus]KAI8082985.1 putative mitochondrial genome maintenance protein Mgm101 [Halteromyces radiatus]